MLTIFYTQRNVRSASVDFATIVDGHEDLIQINGHRLPALNINIICSKFSLESRPNFPIKLGNANLLQHVFVDSFLLDHMESRGCLSLSCLVHRHSRIQPAMDRLHFGNDQARRAVQLKFPSLLASLSGAEALAKV